MENDCTRKARAHGPRIETTDRWEERDFAALVRAHYHSVGPASRELTRRLVSTVQRMRTAPEDLRFDLEQAIRTELLMPAPSPELLAAMHAPRARLVDLSLLFELDGLSAEQQQRGLATWARRSLLRVKRVKVPQGRPKTIPGDHGWVTSSRANRRGRAERLEVDTYSPQAHGMEGLEATVGRYSRRGARTRGGDAPLGVVDLEVVEALRRHHPEIGHIARALFLFNGSTLSRRDFWRSRWVAQIREHLLPGTGAGDVSEIGRAMFTHLSRSLTDPRQRPGPDMQRRMDSGRLPARAELAREFHGLRNALASMILLETRDRLIGDPLPPEQWSVLHPTGRAGAFPASPKVAAWLFYVVSAIGDGSRDGLPDRTPVVLGHWGYDVSRNAMGKFIGEITPIVFASLAAADPPIDAPADSGPGIDDLIDVWTHSLVSRTESPQRNAQ